MVIRQAQTSAARRDTGTVGKMHLTRKNWTAWALGVAVVSGIIELVWCVMAARRGGGIDLEVYRTAAKGLLSGKDVYARGWGQLGLPFTYPPFALVAFTGLSIFTAAGASVVWWVVNAGALWLAVAAVLSTTGLQGREKWIGAAAIAGVASLALEPLRSSLGFGQVNFVLMALVTCDVLGKGRLRGIRTGLAAAVKLTPLAYLAGLAAARQGKAVLLGALSFAAATGLAWVIWPSGSAAYWGSKVWNPGRTGGVTGAANQSEYGLVHALMGTGATPVWMTLSAMTAAAGLWSARRYFASGRRLEALVALALVEVLVSPVSWTHHWSWVVLVAVVGVVNWRRERSLALGCAVLVAVAAVMPYHWTRWSWYAGDTWRMVPGFSLTLGGMALVAVMAISQWREESARSDAGAGRGNDMSGPVKGPLSGDAVIR